MAHVHQVTIHSNVAWQRKASMQTSGFVEIMALANWPVKDHISEATHLGPRHQLVQWNYDKGMVCKTSFGAGMAWSCMAFVWVYQVFRCFFNGIIMCSWSISDQSLPSFCYTNPGVSCKVTGSTLKPQRAWTLQREGTPRSMKPLMLWNSRWINLTVQP